MDGHSDMCCPLVSSIACKTHVSPGARRELVRGQTESEMKERRVQGARRMGRDGESRAGVTESRERDGDEGG